MGSKPLFPADTRGAILEAALQAFSEKGFTATTLDEITSRAGVSKGMAYYYFRNKDELFLFVMKESLGSLEQSLRDELALAKEIHEKMARFVALVTSTFLEYPALYRVLVSHVWQLAEKYPHDVVLARSSFLEPLTAALRDARAAGEISASVNPDLVAPILFGAVAHAVMHNELLGLGLSSADIVQQVWMTIALCYQAHNAEERP